MSGPQSILAAVAAAGIQADPAAPTAFRCAGACDAIVAFRGSTCGPCSIRLAKEDRANLLRSAYASIPAEWPWARFGDAFIAKVKTPTLVAAAKGWRREDGNLVLLGPTGSGKTACALAILHKILDYVRDNQCSAELIRFASKTAFVAATDLARARRESKLGDESPLEREAKTRKLLVLDEIGFEHQRETTIADVLDARYRLGLPTIITSGLDELRFATRYGEATKRRLCERGRVVSGF